MSLSLWSVNFYDRANEVQIEVRLPDEDAEWAEARAKSRIAGAFLGDYEVTVRRIATYGGPLPATGAHA